MASQENAPAAQEKPIVVLLIPSDTRQVRQELHTLPRSLEKQVKTLVSNGEYEKLKEFCRQNTQKMERIDYWLREW